MPIEVQTSKLLLKNTRIIDGTGALPMDNQDILVVNGRIAQIGPNIDVNGQDIRIIDVDGATVLPGLVDAHIHLEAVPGSYYLNLAPES